MKYFMVSAVAAVLAGLADAKAQFTNSAFDVEAGKAFTLTWEGGDGPYQILLKDGPSTNLETVETLVSSTTGTSTTVTLPSTLTSGTYAFEIVDSSDGESNYSQQFTFVGAAASATVSTTASTSKTASSTAASSTSASTTQSNSSSASASTTASTTGSSSTLATTTHSSTSTRTSSSASATSTVANTNGGASMAAPFLAPLILVAGIAAF